MGGGRVIDFWWRAIKAVRPKSKSFYARVGGPHEIVVRFEDDTDW